MWLRNVSRSLAARHRQLLPSSFLLMVALLVSGAMLANRQLDQDKQPLVGTFPTAVSSLGASATAAPVIVEVRPSPTEAAPVGLPLSGRRIGLDPGHGPREDLGSVLVDPDTERLILNEAELNLDVALRVRDILVARGASVVLTRESADAFTAPWPVDANGDGETGTVSDDLQLRVDILNNFAAEVFMSIHANGGMSNPPEEQYLQVLYCGSSDCLFPEENRLVGQVVLDQLKEKLEGVIGPVQGEVLPDLAIDSSSPPEHLFVLGHVNPPRHVRATEMPGVLAEALYVTAPEQAVQLKQDAVRQAIALAYADALQAYLLDDTGAGRAQE